MVCVHSFPSPTFLPPFFPTNLWWWSPAGDILRQASTEEFESCFLSAAAAWRSEARRGDHTHAYILYTRLPRWLATQSSSDPAACLLVYAFPSTPASKGFSQNRCERASERAPKDAQSEDRAVTRGEGKGKDTERNDKFRLRFLALFSPYNDSADAQHRVP